MSTHCTIDRALRALRLRIVAFAAVAASALFGLCLVASEPAFAGRRVALVIGNSAYHHFGILPNTSADAKAIAALFEKAGFDKVDLRTDLGVLDFKRAVRSFLDDASNADIAVVYYAGHGIEASGMNYLVPVDANLAKDYDADDETVSLDRVMLALQPARQLRLIILDACRDNPFLQKMQRAIALRGVSAGLTKVEPATPNTLVAFAAKEHAVSYDGRGPHSPFTTALLKYIGEPGLDIGIALRRVHDEVLHATNGEQEPYVYGSLGGDTISLAPAPETKSTPPTADDTADAKRDYEMAERVGTRQVWESFLAIHGTGFYADLARGQLAKLGETPQTARPAEPLKAADRAKAPKDSPKRQQDANLTKPPVPQRAAEPDAATTPPPRTAAVDAETTSDVCARDKTALTHLRAKPTREEAAQFARSIQCDELRPQLARLLESLGIAPVDPQRPAVVERSDAQSHETVPPTQRDAADPCKEDAEKLVKLRAKPVRAEVENFARDLRCQTLRPQVARLLESLGQ
jgi:uncharacterized caspase-like protein